MIRIENFVGPSPEQWQAVIRGMRNPMNSWDKSDSGMCDGEYCYEDGADDKGWCDGCPYYQVSQFPAYDGKFYKTCEGGTSVQLFRLGEHDVKLAKRLCGAGSEHRKFLRQLPVIMDITAPLYFWRQMSTYKIGTTTDSCSQMHKLTEKEFEVSDFSLDAYWYAMKTGNSEFYEPLSLVVLDIVSWIEGFRKKYLETGDKAWWEAIVELLPQSYNQKRTWSANYEVLRTICHQREGHKLKEWADFIQWVKDNVPYAEELIFS